MGPGQREPPKNCFTIRGTAQVEQGSAIFCIMRDRLAMDHKTEIVNMLVDLQWGPDGDVWCSTKDLWFPVMEGW